MTDKVWEMTMTEWETLRDILKKLVEGPHGLTMRETDATRQLVRIAEESLNV